MLQLQQEAAPYTGGHERGQCALRHRAVLLTDVPVKTPNCTTALAQQLACLLLHS